MYTHNDIATVADIFFPQLQAQILIVVVEFLFQLRSEMMGSVMLQSPTVLKGI